MLHAMYVVPHHSTNLEAELLQLADGLLKLNVPGAGFLADIRTYTTIFGRPNTLI